jgi:hypothetical protein
MTLAARTRQAVRANPFLHEALRAGVLNYTAAARFLDLGTEDRDAVVTALRRYADDLPAYDPAGREARVSMQSGVGPVADPEETLLVVGDTAYAAGEGSATALLVSGAVDAVALSHVLGHLAAEDLTVEAAGLGSSAMVVVVDRRAGPDALRAVEAALEAVPAV